MTIRAELMESLSALQLDNAPTPERQDKSQFSQLNNVWRVKTIAERMYKAERIDESAYHNCQEWARSYVSLYGGYNDFRFCNSTSENKHDFISFTMEQLVKRDNIPAIREYIGKYYDNLLILSLYRCHSAGYIASMVNSKKPRRSIEKMVDSECVRAYQKLNLFYNDVFSRKRLAK